MGFHPEEVSSFLEQIREELEDLLRENAALKERIHKADDEMQRFWETQDLLSRTLQDAHQMSEEYKVHARREVDDLLERTEESVRDMVGEAYAKARQISEEIIELKLIRKDFDEGIRKVLSRFEEVMAGGTVLKEVIFSDEIALASEASSEVSVSVAADEALIPEDQISVIKGHGGEEGSSQAEQD